MTAAAGRPTVRENVGDRGDRVKAARKLFASTQRSLARLYERYPDRDLAVIADFLARNAERLRAETEKLQGV